MSNSSKRLLGSGPAKLQRIGLKTGGVAKGWIPEKQTGDGSILQIGVAGGKGNKNGVTLEKIAENIGISMGSTITIHNGIKGGVKCKVV